MTVDPGALVRRGPREWELWLLRSLLPDAGDADLAELRAQRRRYVEFENAAISRLLAGDTKPLRPGHRLLDAEPELRRGGLVLTVHLGPYQFIPEPFLAAGVSPAILLDERAERRLRPRAEAMIRRLGLPARPEWVVASRSGAMRRLVAALRGDRPVLAFLDGNAGSGGFVATRNRGVAYRLPGREIRVRTGLARLASRLERPIHPLVVRWTDAGALRWSRAPTLRFGRGSDPSVATRRLWDWGFGEILTTPDQWCYWEMIKQSAACFAPGWRPTAVQAGLRADFERAFEICLRRSPASVCVVACGEVEVWSDRILVDVESDRFYAARGLRSADLEILRNEEPTLAALRDRYGEAWVRFHVLRLCLLGLARLGGRRRG